MCSTEGVLFFYFVSRIAKKTILVRIDAACKAPHLSPPPLVSSHTTHREIKERIIHPSTLASEFEAYGLVVAIRFLERSAYDTLARLVDPRGGYILLSTFIEEERETPALATGGSGRSGMGRLRSAPHSNTKKKGQGGAGTLSRRRVLVGTEEEGVATEAARAGNKKKEMRGSAAAALEAAAAAATMARWPHNSPKDPKKILRRGELARYFGDRHGFEVLEDSVERLPDGRPVACFLARRVSWKERRGGGECMGGWMGRYVLLVFGFEG